MLMHFNCRFQVKCERFSIGRENGFVEVTSVPEIGRSLEERPSSEDTDRSPVL